MSGARTPRTPRGPPPTPPPPRAGVAGRSSAATLPSFSTTPPRIGGVCPDDSFGEPWTGGSNLAVKAIPTYLTQRRPYKYSSSQALLSKIEAGIPEKLGLTDKDCSCSFEHWMLLQSNAHVRFGLDTVFMMPDATWTTETNLFQCYSKSWSEIAPWIDQLQTGVSKPGQAPLPACTYDIQNLDYSAIFIKASLTPDFKNEVEHAVGLDASGVRILFCIIEMKLSLQASLQRDLVSQLEKLSITTEPGENIPSFNKKVKDLCTAIEKCGTKPLDLNLLVMKCFVNCSVPIFAQHINTLFFECKRNHNAHPWRTTLENHASMYYQLKDMWTPEASKPVTNKEFQNFVKTTKTSMNKLTVRQPQSGSNKTATPASSTTVNTKKCWDCGKPDVVKGHPNCTQPGKGYHIPKDKRPATQPKAATPSPFHHSCQCAPCRCPQTRCS